MANDKRSQNSSTLLVTVASIGTAAGIFILDILLPLGVAAGVPYVGLVLISLYSSWRYYPAFLAAISTVLIFLGYLFSPALGIPWIVITNRLLAVFVVWMTAEFCRRRLQVDKELKIAEAFPRAILKSSPDYIFVLNSEGVVLMVNRTQHGHIDEDVVGQKATMFIPDKYHQAFNEAFRKASESGELQTLETVIMFHGQEHNFHNRLKPVSIAGQEDMIVLITTDVTERKQAEIALNESENKYRTLFDKSADAILIIEEGQFVDCNTATVEMLGYKNKKELLETHPSQLSPETQPDGKQSFTKANEMMALAFKKGSHRFEWDHRRFDGEIFPVEVLLTAVTFGERQFLHTVWRDITERKRLEEAESRSARLEIAGTIAGQVAHDFNNLLAPLMAYPEFIRDKLPKDHPTLKYLFKIEKASQKIADINQQLLSLGRRGHYNLKVINVNSIIKQAVNEMIASIEENTISLNLEPNLKSIFGGDAQIHRVITNLLHNAADALKQSGKIAVRTENYFADDVSGIYGRVPRGEYVKLTITDNGSGMADEIVKKILDPFFTTKASDQKRGSGLGLSVVDAVIKDHNGFLDLKTTLGQGTSFYIYFPITSRTADDDQSDNTTGGSETILVVDDDHIQREVSTQLLQHLGYKVYSVESGEKAIEFLLKNPQELVLLDMIMPGGIDGTETFQQILKINPQQKAIIVSGFSETDRVQQALALGVGAFVKKPLTKKAIALAVRKELDKETKTLTK